MVPRGFLLASFVLILLFAPPPQLRSTCGVAATAREPRLLLENDSASPAERLAVDVAAKENAGALDGAAAAGANATTEGEVAQPLLPEEEIRGPALEAEIEEEIAEFEESGGLLSSLIVWVLALAAPAALLLYLRLKTNLLGGGPPQSAVLSALEQAATGSPTTPGGGGAAAGAHKSGKSSAAGSGNAGAAAAGDVAGAAGAASASNKAGACSGWPSVRDSGALESAFH
jgi:hypothetical protein